MNRFIFIEDGVVRNAATTNTPEAGNALALCDLLNVFSPGDVFDREKYEAAYPDMYHPFAPADPQALVYTPTPFIERSQLPAAGLAFSPYPHVAAKYVYTSSDTQESFDALRAFGVQHGVAVPDFSLCDKGLAPQKFVEAGFDILTTRPIRSKADVEEFPHDRVIVKPAVSSDTKARGPLAPALYKVVTKAQAVAELDALGVFSDPALLAAEPLIVQQVADGDGDQFEALILSGCVNGAGDVWHFSPLCLETRFNEHGRFVRSTWSPENDTAETAMLQQKVDTLIAGNKNCFYHLQFLKAGGLWVPHDFQFRTTYYTEYGLAQTGYLNFKQDIVKFVYDRSPAKPAMPRSFGLLFCGFRDFDPFSSYVSGATRDEVLAALGQLPTL